MSYQVIARKWRPQTFEEVTGQEAITRTLRNAIEHERLHHAYLFSGARGVGKTTTARLLAKALNCHKTTKPNPTPCAPSDPAACPSCVEIAEGRSIDVLEFDAASNTQVDKIRDLIIENINIAPARDRYKVFIIDEVHMLSTSSFNALLKTLEEPPPNVVFIMATTELHKVPDTILSRCQEFEFRTIPTAKIFERLKLIGDAEKVAISDEALREIARSGEGSMRDAQSNFDQVISFSGEKIAIADVVNALGIASSEMLTRTIQAIAGRNAPEILNVVEDLIRRGQDLRNFCRDLLSFFRDLLVAKVSDAEELLDSAAFSRNELRQNAEKFSEADLIRFFNSLSDTETKLKTASQPRYILEIGLIKLLEMQKVTPIEKLLERLAQLENALGKNGNSGGSAPISGGAPEKKTLAADPNDFPAAPPIEKKTLAVNFNAEEVPFSVGPRATAFANQTPAVVPSQTAGNGFSAPQSAAVTATAVVLEEPDYLKDAPPSFENESTVETVKPPIKPILQLDAEFLDSIPIKLPPITADELEHIEDNALDTAYEERLKREGDNLKIIKNAAEVASALITSGEPQSSFSNASPENAANGRNVPSNAVITPIFVPPVYESSDDSDEIPVLPENPTDEQLLAYAKNHPIVKKVRWHLKADIVKVSKIEQT